MRTYAKFTLLILAGVLSFHGCDNGTGSSAPPLPAAPLQLSPSDGANNLPASSTLGWNAAANAVSYRLQIAGNASLSSPQLDTSGLAGTAFVVSGLTAGTRYYWRVNATNATGTGAWSATWSFITDSLNFIPPVPVPVSPSDSAVDVPTSAALIWNRAAQANSYRVQVVAAGTSFEFPYFDSTGVRDTTLAVTGLSNGARYYWRVNATNATGTSAWSQIKIFTTAAIMPSLITSANITLGSWQAIEPSSLDADVMTAYNATSAAANSQNIDLCFFSDTSGNVFFMSPSRAALEGFFPMNWTTRNTTAFIQASGIAFDSVNFQSGIDSIWAADSANATQRIPVVVNGVYVVNTSRNEKKLLNVVGTPGSGNFATVVIRGKY